MDSIKGSKNEDLFLRPHFFDPNMDLILQKNELKNEAPFFYFNLIFSHKNEIKNENSFFRKKMNLDGVGGDAHKFFFQKKLFLNG